MVGRGMGKNHLKHHTDRQKGVMEHAFVHESVATDEILAGGVGKRPRFRKVSSVLQDRVVPPEDNVGRVTSQRQLQQENMTNHGNNISVASQETLQQENMSNGGNSSRVALQEPFQPEHTSTGATLGWGAMNKRSRFRTVDSVINDCVVSQTDNSSHDALQENIQHENVSTRAATIKKKISRVDFTKKLKDVLVATTILPPVPPSNHEQHLEPSGDEDYDEILQDNDLLHNQDAGGSSTKGVTKTRGPYTSEVIYKKTKHGNKLQVHVPGYVTRVLGENARPFVNYCGFILRNIVPLTVKNWKDASEEYFERIWLKIMDKFQLPDCEKENLQEFCEKLCSTALRNWKARVSKHYKKCLKRGWEPLQHCPDTVSGHDWKYSIEKFESEEFKKVSQRNSKNRNSVKWIKHTSGPVSFAEVEDMMTQQNNNVKPTPDVVWIAQHTHRGDDGSYRWVNDQRSQEVHANIHALVEQSIQEGSIHMTDVEILTTVIKPRSGHITGKGSCYQRHSKRSKNQDKESAEIETLKRNVVEMKEDNERTLKELKEGHEQALQNLHNEQETRMRAFIREEIIRSGSSLP